MNDNIEINLRINLEESLFSKEDESHLKNLNFELKNSEKIQNDLSKEILFIQNVTSKISQPKMKEYLNYESKKIENLIN